MKRMILIILIVTTLASALISGLFYSYSCSVNIGLGKLANEGYLAAMQSINKEILNPLFFASFMGTLLLLPVSTFLQFKAGATSSAQLLLIATLLYAVGVFGVTMFGNVPLNNSLDKFNLKSATLLEIAEQRLMFEKPWNKLHAIRTVACVISLLLVIISNLKNSAMIEPIK